MPYLRVIIGIVLEALSAQLDNKPVDYAAIALRIYSASKAMYEAQKGQPIDESLVPPFEPIP